MKTPEDIVFDIIDKYRKTYIQDVKDTVNLETLCTTDLRKHFADNIDEIKDLGRKLGNKEKP